MKYLRTQDLPNSRFEIENWAWHNEWFIPRHQDYNNHHHTTSILGDEYKKHKRTTKIGQFFKGCSSIKNQAREFLFSIIQYVATSMCIPSQN
jgi:hypothetical protein